MRFVFKILFKKNLAGWNLLFVKEMARLFRDLRHAGIICIQERHLVTSGYKNALSKKFRFFWAYFESHSIGFNYLVICSYSGTCLFYLRGCGSRVCALDVTIKEKVFRFIAVSLPDIGRKGFSFYRPIDSFLIMSRWVVLAGDCNTITDPNWDTEATGMSLTRLQM